MHRIDKPAYAREIEIEIDDEFSEEYLSLQQQRDVILAVFDQAVADYIASNAYDEPNMFPSKCRLTGEYYISQEYYSVRREPWLLRAGETAEYRFSLRAFCLEYRTVGDDQDYLGLEVHFFWYPERKTFAFDGDVDSSSI